MSGGEKAKNKKNDEDWTDYYKNIEEYSPTDFEPVLHDLVTGSLHVDDIMQRHVRIRRSVTKKDTIEHVTKIMESIEEELDDLKKTQVHHANEADKKLMISKCLVLPKGGVNCTQSVYKDPNEWRVSRREIEQQIRDMRMQLETLKEIRRHLMTKKPPLIPEIDHEESTVVKNSHGNTNANHHHVHQSHGHHAKYNTSRHHRKHEGISTPETLSSTPRPQKHTTNPKEFSTVVKEESGRNLVAVDLDLELTTREKGSTVLNQRTTTPKSERQKAPRRQKTKEFIEVEEEKPQRRRKTHHHKRNSTVLTNSVHDQVSTGNATGNITVTVKPQTPPAPHRHHHNYPQYETKLTTLSASSTTHKPSKNVEEDDDEDDEDDDKESNFDNKDFARMTTEPVTLRKPAPIPDSTTSTEALTTGSITATQRLTKAPTISVKRPIKSQRNRTSVVLGPARIDVTILEAPDRRHNQGKVCNLFNIFFTSLSLRKILKNPSYLKSFD